MEQLANHNVPVPDVITTRLGKKYALASSQGMRWLGLVTQFYPGQSPQEYTPQLRSGLAEYQARAHAVALQLPSPRRVRIESPLSCYAVNSSDRKYRHPGIRQLVARASAYTVTPDQSLPVALVHLDMDAGNVLAQEDQIHAVIDFGHVSYAPLSACLANTLWHVFITTKTETAVLDYLRVYETIRPLQQNEYRAIQEYALMRHYTVTLLCAHAWNTPEEEMHSLLAEEQQILEVFSRIATRATSQERA
jgi:Ser/Thr protein kinase RdoA (MazF antagonist)